MQITVHCSATSPSKMSGEVELEVERSVASEELNELEEKLRKEG